MSNGPTLARDALPEGMKLVWLTRKPILPFLKSTPRLTARYKDEWAHCLGPIRATDSWEYATLKEESK